MTPTSEPVTLDVAALLRHGTSTVGEVAGGGCILAPGIRAMFAGAELGGPAYTVDTGPGHNLWIHRAIYSAPPGSVLVVSCGDAYEYGYWGEILSTAARVRDLAGLVIDGGVRDVLALARVGFPVFAREICPRGTGKRTDLGAGTGVPVQSGGVVVNPGDFVLGDADGVLGIPPQHLDGLLDRAAARTSKELLVIEDLKRGRTSIDVLQLES
jgi:4-hydroxy-4-methyl-2-oxoglutarate aldolase